MSSCCAPSSGRAPAPAAAPAIPASRGPGADVIWIKGGRSYTGTDRPLFAADGEGPRRPVKLAAFGLDRYAVTNRRFAAFVADTGYVTDAETYGWSFVFERLVDPETARRAQRVAAIPWWLRIDGADWRHPLDPQSNIAALADHPVIHISANDAQAFAAWAGGRLPTEAEWEHAARAGTDAIFPWGDAEPEDENLPCNIWRGQFPNSPDGHIGTMPVGSYPPNPLGLYDMAGNVWEWSADRFRVRSLAAAAKARNAAALADNERLLKGGSYLCHRSYCHRYRIAGRMGRSADTSTGHIGFRLAFDAPPGF